MIITQFAWVTGVAIISLGILAIGACIHSSHLSQWLDKTNKDNARLRMKLGKKSIMESLRDE